MRSVRSRQETAKGKTAVRSKNPMCLIYCIDKSVFLLSNKWRRRRSVDRVFEGMLLRGEDTGVGLQSEVMGRAPR
jgi:hypothetical protein